MVCHQADKLPTVSAATKKPRRWRSLNVYIGYYICCTSTTSVIQFRLKLLAPPSGRLGLDAESKTSSLRPPIPGEEAARVPADLGAKAGASRRQSPARYRCAATKPCSCS